MTIAARYIDITTEEITCGNGMPAFLAYPAGGGRFPTVVLMHERYGLVKHFTEDEMTVFKNMISAAAITAQPKMKAMPPQGTAALKVSSPHHDRA